MKKIFPFSGEVSLVPWTHVTGPALAALNRAGAKNRVTVECTRDRITILLNGVQVTGISDSSFSEGYVGMAHYGSGRTLFRDFRVESFP